MQTEIEIRLERFLTVNNAVLQGTRDGLQAGGKDVVELAAQLAPKETEELSKSGRSELNNDGALVISFGNGLPDARAPAQEFGTVEMPAQPYLLPAVRAINFAQHIADAIIRRLS